MFGLNWTEVALQELSDLYVDAPREERAAMAAAIDGMNNALRLYPLEVGESRAGRDRVAFPATLVVRFEVDEDDAVVLVYHVHRGR